MYPSTAYPSAAAEGIFGALLTGGVLGLLVVFFVAFVGYYVYYLITKAAVRNGMIEAMRKMDASGFGGGGGMVNGYPPAQSGFGPPPSPSYGGYRGPDA